MRRTLYLFPIILITVPLLSCTPVQQGALVGGTLGAATGAVVGGAALGRPGAGALVGGSLGAVTGALVADAQQHFPEECDRVYPSQPCPARRIHPPRRTYDPTRGRVINATPWEVHLFVDPGGRGSQRIIPPGGRTLIHLDVGDHTLLARAYVSTFFGPRLVGQSRQVVRVDPRARGWTLRLTEDLF